jgi:hypothetical protein
MENSTVRQYKLLDLERKCLVNKFPLKQLGRSVQLVVADERDIDVIRQYLTDEFHGREPLNVAVGILIKLRSHK